MTRFVALSVLMILTFVTTVCQADGDFDSRFTNATLRVDYNHTGAAGEEILSLDRLYEEGPWPGPRVNLIDNLDLGRYQAKLLDTESGDLVWSRGFDSYFGEWKTTVPAANGVRRTYHESVRTPFPRGPVTFVLEHRENDAFVGSTLECAAKVTDCGDGHCTLIPLALEKDLEADKGIHL